MKSVLKIFTPFISIGLFLPVFVFAQTPSLPHQFFGTVTFTNGVAPNGLSVQAKINGVVVGSSVTASGNYGYNPNLLFVTDNQNTNAGKTIEFFVSGIKANETAIFTNGNSTKLNLTIPAPTPTSSPTPPASSGGSGSGRGGGSSGGGVTTPSSSQTATQTPASSGGGSTGGGGGGGVTTPSTPASTLSTAAQKVDANKDNKIDILDFNLLMVNWGSASVNNVADFNGDGKVDVFDFNLLMINWTL